MATLTANWPGLASETRAGFNIKSYFVDSVNLARESARRELGENALLLRSRDAAPEARDQGRYEVVFAVDSKEETSPSARTESTSGEVGVSTPENLNVTGASRVHGNPEGLGNLLAATDLSRLLVLSPRLYPLFTQLVSRGFEYNEACDLAATVQRSGLLGIGDKESRVRGVIEGKSEAAIERLLLNILGDKLACDARVGITEGGRRTILLVGPPGAGKTTTLVKLAIQQGLAQRRSIRLLSTDAHRAGGIDQLGCYAETLGVDWQPCRSAGELTRALENGSGTDLTFIDTAGFSASDIGAAADVAGCIRERQDIDTHLVLPASAKQADMLQWARRYEVFRPAKLLFTRLDESCSFASLYGVAAGTGKPVSFLTTGPSIPEDIEPATTERLIGLVWGGSVDRANAAAA